MESGHLVVEEMIRLRVLVALVENFRHGYFGGLAVVESFWHGYFESVVVLYGVRDDLVVWVGEFGCVVW